MANNSNTNTNNNTNEQQGSRDGELRSSSMTSINTLASIGFPETKDALGQLDEDSYSAGSGEFVCLEAESHSIPKDVICLLVVCPQHCAVAFKQIVNDCYFLPTFQFDGDSQLLSETMRNVIGMHDPAMLAEDYEYTPRMQLIDLYRVELLKTRSFVHRYIFQIVLTKKEGSAIGDSKGPCVCSAASANQQPGDSLALINRTTNSEDTVWITLQSVPANINNIWGGEPFKMFLDLCPQPAEPKPLGNAVQFRLSEVDSDLPRALLARTDWLSPMLDSIRHNLPNMLDSAVFNLYNEFVVQCFPSNSMGFSSFCIMLDKLGLVCGANAASTPIEPRKRIFRALDRRSRSYVEFEDLCMGLIVFESNNDIADLPNRQEYIFRFYDGNADGKLELEEYKQLLIDFIGRSKIDEQLKKLDKTKPALIKETFDKTWVGSSMNFEQYLKAFESINQSLAVNTWWLPTVGFFEQVFLKFNCRNLPTTAVQHIVDDAVNFNRCEVCSERKFALSGSLVQLSDIGNILKIFHLKATKAADNTLIKFAEEFQEKNIHNIANEFLIRIEKIGAYDPNALDAEEEENIKNYFFPTRHKMLRYLHLVLEYAKPLIDADAKVLELNAPCYVFGDLNGSLKDLLRFSGTVFRTFPFIDTSSLLFLGNYTDAESAFNLECLIYLICMKILSPGRVFLLRGANELAGRQQIQMQDRDHSDEPLNDIVCNLLAQIFDSFPIAAVLEESIFTSHSGIPKEFSLSHMKLICQCNSNALASLSTIQLQPSVSISSVASTEYGHLMEELLLQVIIGEPSTESQSSISSAESLFTSGDFELFLSSSKLFCAIRSHQEFPEDGFRLNANFNLLTLVSASKGAKVPVCAYIDHKRIRLIRFDTNV